MASGTITSWEIDGETVEVVSDFIFWSSKITADGDCSHEIKRCLSPWKESSDQPRYHSQKQRHYFANKGPSGQGYAFSTGHVWMWEFDCEESWALKNWCFWTIVLDKTLESPLTARRSNQSILKEISPGCSLEGLMLKLKLSTLATSCKELTHWKRPWCWEGLGAGGEGDDRKWDGWMASPTPWAWVWVNSWSLWWTGRPGMLRFMGSQRVGQDWSTELNWGISWGFPGGSDGKVSAYNVGDLGLIPGLGRSPGKGKGYPPQAPHINISLCLAYFTHIVSSSFIQVVSGVRISFF